MQTEKSVDCVLGIRTRGRRIVGTCDTTMSYGSRPQIPLNFALKNPERVRRVCPQDK